MKYRKDIDGLRALAVLPVVLYHGGIGLFSGGYVGVDIFFVISGYLITTLISEEIKNGTFTIKNFYLRRIKRIFPALFFILSAVTIMCLFLQMPYDLRNYGKSLSAAVFFCSNLYFNRQSGYFTDAAETKPLLHTWSLSIEEQFYIFFPLLLIIISKYMKGHFRAVLSSVFAVSLIYATFIVGSNPENAFYQLLPRAWELLTGALLAYKIFPDAEKKPGTGILAAAGLFMVIVPVFAYDKNTVFPAYSAIAPCLGAGLIIYTGKAETLVSKILSSRPLVFFGLISYSLYLWHWPLISFYNQYREVLILSAETEAAAAAGLIFLALLFSVLTYRYVETPFRKMQISSLRLFFGSTALIMLLFGISGGLLYWSKGFPQRLPAEIAQINSGHDDIEKTKSCSDSDIENITPDRLKVLGSKTKVPEFILLGDSHGGAFAPGIDAYASSAGISGFAVTFNGMPPVTGIGHKNKKCFTEIPAKTLEIAKNNPGIKTVVLAGRWGLYTHNQENSRQQNEIYYPSGKPVPENLRNLFMTERLKATVDELKAAGKNVVIILPVPETESSVPHTLAKILYLNRMGITNTPDIRETDSQYKAANADVFEMIKHAGAQTADPAKILNNGGKFDIIHKGGSIYMDSNHLTKSGSVYVFSRLGKEIFR